MKNRCIFQLIFLLVVPLLGLSQSDRQSDFGAIVGTQFTKDLPRNFSLSVEEEIRFDNDFTQFDRWLNSFGFDYGIYRNRLKVGLTADYIRRQHKDGYFENRCRLSADLSYSESFRRFKFSYRSKLMSTFLDEKTGTHPVNPKTYWRNRFQVSFQMPNSRFKYGLSSEIHWLINNPGNNSVDDIRTVFSVDYRLSRRHTISAFARMDNEIQVKNPIDTFYFGLIYKMKY